MRPQLVATAVVAVGSALAAGWWLGHAAPQVQAPQTMAAGTLPSQPCAPAAASTQQADMPQHAGMVWVPGGAFTMGANGQYPEEGPAVAASVDGFWMDQTEVTNAQFAAFVAATGYRTLAERGVQLADDGNGQVVSGSAVFHPPPAGAPPRSFVDWWRFVPGADWRHPQGPASSIAGLEHYPVVHVAYEDAQAYARWKGASLPTEAQFEYAAQTSTRRESNTWQGSFPAQDTGADGHAGVAPVACHAANRLGLHDMLGNVWEWTATPYFDGHDADRDATDRARHPQGNDPAQPGEAVAVLKGGSYLCSPDYCMRYRPEARIGQSLALGTSHIGFRTVAKG
jgi:formylglycine-generating enzyme required for sulfatase activity